MALEGGLSEVNSQGVGTNAAIVGAKVGRVESIHFSLRAAHTAIVDLGEYAVPFSSTRFPCFERGDYVAVSNVQAPLDDDNTWQGQRNGVCFVLRSNKDFDGTCLDNDVHRLPDLPIGSDVPQDLGRTVVTHTMHVLPNWVSS